MILALDPGKRDFAWAAIDGVKIPGFGMIHHTIYDIDAMHAMPQRAAFVGELTAVLNKYNPNVVVIERMQQRPGMGGGAPAEYINVMIGVVLEICAGRGIKFRGVTAATWKNHMKLAYDPKPDRSKMKKGERTKALPHCARMQHYVSKTSKTAPIKDHEFDAIGIGQWFCEMRDKQPLLNIFIKQIDKVWEMRLVNIQRQKQEDREASKARTKKRAENRRKKPKSAAKTKPVRAGAVRLYSLGEKAKAGSSKLISRCLLQPVR